MGAFGGLILTNRGKTLQSKAQAGVTLEYTRIAIGDGQLGTTPILDLNSLRHQVKSLSITKLKILSGGKAVVGTVWSNSDLTEGFYFREIGVFANDPDLGEILYCYANSGELAEYIPPGGGSDLIERSLDIQTLVGNAANITAVIDTSLVYATKPELDSVEGALTQQIEDVQQTVTTHSADDTAHITAQERTSWNAKETPSGAQKKIEQSFFKTKKSNKDTTAETYTVVEHRRENNTLAKRATLINPDANGKFQNRKHEFFGTDGQTIEKTVTTTLYYDAEGEFIEEV